MNLVCRETSVSGRGGCQGELNQRAQEKYVCIALVDALLYAENASKSQNIVFSTLVIKHQVAQRTEK